MKPPKNSTAAFYTDEMIEKHGKEISGKSGEIYEIHSDAFFNSVYQKAGFNPRLSEFGSDEDDILLVESVINGAILPPIEIFKDESGKFFVVSGHRRYSALKMAIDSGTPIQKISVRVIPAKNPKTGLKYTEADLLALSIGQNRGKALTHSEMSDTVIRLKKFGWKTEAIMAALSLSRNQVSQYSVLSQGTEELKKAVDAGTGNRKDGIGFVDAVNTAREYADEPEKQNEIVEEKVKKRKEKPEKPKEKSEKFTFKKQSDSLWIVYENKNFSGFIQKASGRFHFVYPDDVIGSGNFSNENLENLIELIKKEF